MKLALLLALLMALPASAETYICFAPGSVKQNMIIQSSYVPVPGKDYPVGWIVKPWVRQGDDDPNNYKLENDTVILDKPVISLSVIDQVAQEIEVCLNSKADKLSDQQFVTVLRISKIRDKSVRDTEWAQVKDTLP